MGVATTFYKGNMNMPIVQWDKQSTNLGLIGSCFTAAHSSSIQPTPSSSQATKETKAAYKANRRAPFPALDKPFGVEEISPPDEGEYIH